MKRTVLMLATALATSAAAPGPAASDMGVDVHVGSHDGFGRVVFDIPHSASFTVERSGDTATVRFDGAGLVPDADHGTRNVTSVRGGNSMAVIALKPGVRLRTMRLGDRAVVDVMDAVVPAKPVASTAPAPAEAAAAPVAPAPAAPAAPPPAAPVTPVLQASLPPAPVAVPAVSAPPEPVAAPPRRRRTCRLCRRHWCG